MKIDGLREIVFSELDPLRHRKLQNPDAFKAIQDQVYKSEMQSG
jgi:hypothetical protein